ncbi:MAG: pyridoxamine 5-phosphate oxidase-related FMN-binding protein [Solirubrobacterales bacterium]|nr:pyridoxamine 5-phosphate oxidase-related FMN-binding protein [Solirubrobacterales bacterium]
MGAADDFYHEGARLLQDRFDTRRLADTGVELLFPEEPVLDAAAQAFIARMDMVFVGTADAQGRPHCSYKGGDPGFVRIVDERTLALPNYDGNGFYNTWGNVLVNPLVDLLFIDFQATSPWRLRVKGTAAIAFDGPLVAAFHEAQFVVRVTVTHVYAVCPRYVHTMRVVERSRFVPEVDRETPLSEWKLEPDVVPPEVLSTQDRARAETERRRAGGAPAPPTHAPFPEG